MSTPTNQAETKTGRRVVAQITTTLDGRVSGPKGPDDMEVVARYAGSDAAHARSAEALAAATTALMGRVNYEGFYGYWPSVAVDETADPRDRNIARWLDDVDKVVFSTTMTHATWVNSRLADRGPVDEVRMLRGDEGGDILVVNSVSIIRQLWRSTRSTGCSSTWSPRWQAAASPCSRTDCRRRHGRSPRR
jgi:hypothetical protein